MKPQTNSNWIRRGLAVLAACASLWAVAGNRPTHGETAAQAKTIGYWLFNEKSPGGQTTGLAGEIIDSSGNGHHGRAVGSPLPSYVAGVLNSPSAIALTKTDPFDASSEDRILVPHNAAFNLMLADLQDYTIEAFIKTASGTGSCGIFTHRATTGVGYCFRLDNTGKLSFYIEGTGNNFTDPDAIGKTAVTDGRWHHVAVVIQPNANPALASVTFYVDYAFDGSVYLTDVVHDRYKYLGNTWVNENIVNAADVWIGDFVGRATDQFEGGIDMVRFSTGALTPDRFAGAPKPAVLASLAAGPIGSKPAHHLAFQLFYSPGRYHDLKSTIHHPPSKISTWFYPRGAFGRDHDHRHLDRVVVAGGAGGPRGGPAGAVQK